MRRGGKTKGRAAVQDYAAAACEHISEGWVAQLRAVWNALTADAERLAELTDQSRDFAARRGRLDELLPAKLNPEARNLLYVMLRDGQIGLLGEVVERLAQTLVGGERQVARVVTAVPPTPKERESLRAIVARRFGQGVEVQFEVDPEILGGVLIKAGDRVIDGSLAGRLAALHQRLRSSR
ncbi:MAG: ATP synthase F1 subunit delta [Calditrichaeota bacterium]|nr:ATP synthase F1 subunit delta [Calditrichota bacterium]